MRLHVDAAPSSPDAATAAMSPTNATRLTLCSHSANASSFFRKRV